MGIQWYQRLQIRSFRKRLLICFILCSVIPILIIGIIAYSQSYHISRRNIMDSVQFSSHQISQSIDARLTQVEKVSDSVESQLFRLLRAPREPYTAFLDRYSEAKSSITNLEYTFDLYSINIFLSEQEMVSREGIMFSSLSRMEPFLLSQEEQERGMKIQPSWCILRDAEVKRVPIAPGHQEDILACYRLKQNISTGEMEYAFFIVIQTKEIIAMLKEQNKEDEIKQYLIDENGMVIAHPDTKKMGTVLPEDVFTPQQGFINETKDSLYVADPLTCTDWTLVTEVPKQYITRNINSLISIFLAALACVLCTTVLITALLSKGMSRKLSLLSHTMRRYKAEGDTKGLTRLAPLAEVPKDRSDEFDELALNFKEMAGRIEDNFTQMMEMKLQKEKLNYQLLQSQINPHFLYNILESIKSCQTMGRIDTANQMISKLVRFYRQQLSNDRELIPIRDELEIGITYLEIEALCRADRLTWDICCDEGIDEFLICRFSIQPVLENCVVHAFRPDGTPLHIQIRVSYDEELIRLEISDNGSGMTADSLQNLRSALESREINLSKHYGLCNINARLSMYCSNQGACVTAESKEGHGTTVRIQIDQMIG